MVLQKMHRITKFNQMFWLKLYIKMNIELRKKQKMSWERFFQVFDNSVFEKNYGKCKRAQRYQGSKNWEKKELCRIKTNL